MIAKKFWKKNIENNMYKKNTQSFHIQDNSELGTSQNEYKSTGLDPMARDTLLFG